MAKSKRPRQGSHAELTLEQFEAMTPEEKEAVYREVDREIPLSELRPLNAQERKRWNKFKKRLGRPKVGRGAKLVTVSLERGRAEQIDEFLRRHGLGRSTLFARGAELAMAEIERKTARKRAS